tara:strand:- start:74 stop:400 length:327 start_codon:yes stop_codon:yes gene_type:complete
MKGGSMSSLRTLTSGGASRRRRRNRQQQQQHQQQQQQQQQGGVRRRQQQQSRRRRREKRQQNGGTIQELLAPLALLGLHFGLSGKNKTTKTRRSRSSLKKILSRRRRR